MAVALTRENSLDAFEQRQSTIVNAQPKWLGDKRHGAISWLQDNGIPTPKHEDWKYTDVRALVKRSYEFETSAIKIDNEIPPLGDTKTRRLVFVNGHFDAAMSDIENLPEGLTAGSLARQLDNQSATVQEYLGRAIAGEGHGFSALNTAFVNDGLFVHVAANAKIDEILEVVFVCASVAVAPLAQPRNLIVLDDGASLQLVERYIGFGEDAYLTNAVNEIFVGADARLDYCRLQEESTKAGHIGGLFVRQKARSLFVSNTIALEGQLIRNDVRVELDEPEAECHVNGLTLANGRQHVDHHTQINHNVERCVSRELYKGVLDDRSRSVFHGRIVVAKDAQKTDSEQQNQNLLLSRDAEIDTKPQLEIYADDVKCSHGATVGQLDEDQVFYLRARGIEESHARSLLTFAFARSALAEVAESGIRQYVEQHLHSRLQLES
jgi:Fe-S cluster assembly protein SufD